MQLRYCSDKLQFDYIPHFFHSCKTHTGVTHKMN